MDEEPAHVPMWLVSTKFRSWSSICRPSYPSKDMRDVFLLELEISCFIIILASNEGNELVYLNVSLNKKITLRLLGDMLV